MITSVDDLTDLLSYFNVKGTKLNISCSRYPPAIVPDTEVGILLLLDTFAFVSSVHAPE